ncbi:MAG: HAMP domain-containing sensor histidine kinase, partial [Balneolaceae bacterium]
QQQTKNLETTQQLTNRNFLLIIAFSLLIITVVIAFFLYKNSLVRKKANTLLQEKNVEIEQQAAKLQEMNEIKTHLFSIISHDLRGPLSSLYGFITLNEMDALSKDQIQRLLPELSEKFNSTSNLLNNLLNWAKSQLEGYKVIPEKFELKEIAKQTLKLLSHKVENKNLYVTIDLDDVVHVYADKNMMELVLLNLLSNAIKFTPNKGAIHLTASEKENSVKLCIQDSGVGISEKKLQMLFNKTNFYSTEGTNDEKGTGLGLILCKDFVRQNKGIFSAESEVDKGSKFCFTLPKAESD